MDLFIYFIYFVIFLCCNPAHGGLTRIRVKDDGGGKLWIYEMIGDILISRYREGEPRVVVDGRKKIFGSSSSPKPWSRGLVPFTISSHFSEDERKNILLAFSQLTDETKKCINFVPRQSQSDYIRVEKSAHTCSSNMGKIGGQQQILLSPRCASHPTLRSITHELLHTLGFHHEQSRSDRDRYVRIHLQNVKPDHEFNYDKARVTNNEVTDFDYDSILIYGPMDFTSNGWPTMSPARPGVRLKPNLERIKLTPLDVEKIRKLYKC